MTLVIVLILLALLGVLGTVVKGLLWLTFIAIALLFAGLAFGYFKLKGFKSSSSD